MSTDPPRRPLPPFESDVYLTYFSMCHRRMQALQRVAEGRQRPDDQWLWITGAEMLLARHGWTPKDFGFVDPPTFDVKPNTGTLWAPLDAKGVN